MHPHLEQDLGPPKMRSPGGKPGQRKVSVDWTTDNPYTRAAQSSTRNYANVSHRGWLGCS